MGVQENWCHNYRWGGTREDFSDLRYGVSGDGKKMTLEKNKRVASKSRFFK